MNIVAKNIKFLREYNGLDTKTLAASVGVDEQTYLAWEVGSSLPNSAQLQTISKALGESDIKKIFSPTFIEDFKSAALKKQAEEQAKAQALALKKAQEEAEAKRIEQERLRQEEENRQREQAIKLQQEKLRQQQELEERLKREEAQRLIQEEAKKEQMRQEQEKLEQQKLQEQKLARAEELRKQTELQERLVKEEEQRQREIQNEQNNKQALKQQYDAILEEVQAEEYDYNDISQNNFVQSNNDTASIQNESQQGFVLQDEVLQNENADYIESSQNSINKKSEEVEYDFSEFDEEVKNVNQQEQQVSEQQNIEENSVNVDAADKVEEAFNKQETTQTTQPQKDAQAGKKEKIVKEYIPGAFSANENSLYILKTLAFLMLATLFLPCFISGGVSLIGFEAFKISITSTTLVYALAVCIVAYIIILFVVQYKMLKRRKILNKHFAAMLMRFLLVAGFVIGGMSLALILFNLQILDYGLLTLSVLTVFFFVTSLISVFLIKPVLVGTKVPKVIKYTEYVIHAKAPKRALLASSIISLIVFIVCCFPLALAVINFIKQESMLTIMGLDGTFIETIVNKITEVFAVINSTPLVIVMLSVFVVGILYVQISNFKLYARLKKYNSDSVITAEEMKSLRVLNISNLIIAIILYAFFIITFLVVIFGSVGGVLFAYSNYALIILTALSVIVVYKLCIYVRVYKSFRPTADELQMQFASNLIDEPSKKAPKIKTAKKGGTQDEKK